MTREEFIKVLDEKGYSYKIKGNKIVVTDHPPHYGVDLVLNSLETLPPGVEFKNGGVVDLESLKTLPPGVEFKNGSTVFLSSLETLPPDVKFKNGGGVYLESLKTIPHGMVFRNKGSIHLNSLETIPPGMVFRNGNVYFGLLTRCYFNDWTGNIEGIAPNTLLNGMIKIGLFL